MEGEEGLGEALVIVGGGGFVVRITDSGAVAGKGNFAPGAVGRVTFAEGLDGEFVACGLDDEFGDASGIAIGVDPGSDEVGRGGDRGVREDEGSKGCCEGEGGF